MDPRDTSLKSHCERLLQQAEDAPIVSIVFLKSLVDVDGLDELVRAQPAFDHFAEPIAFQVLLLLIIMHVHRITHGL